MDYDRKNHFQIIMFYEEFFVCRISIIMKKPHEPHTDPLNITTTTT